MDPESIAYLLLAVGVLLLAGEMFFPTGGVLAGAGVLAALVGVAMLYVNGHSTKGTIALLGLCIGMPIMGGIFLYFWPYSPMTKKLMRVAEEDATVATMPANQELHVLVGRIGKTVSALRPSGTVDFDGRRIDVMAEGLPLDPGAWVKCIAVQGNKVLVRLTEAPTVTKLEEADFS